MYGYQEADHRGLIDGLSTRVTDTGGGESPPNADSDSLASHEDADPEFADTPRSSPVDAPDPVRPTPSRGRPRPFDYESNRPTLSPRPAPGLGNEARSMVSTGGVNIEIPLPPGYLDVTDTAVEWLETARRLSPPGNRVLAMLVPRETTRLPGWPSLPIEEIKRGISIHVVRSTRVRVDQCSDVRSDHAGIPEETAGTSPVTACAPQTPVC